ncbi:MAG: PepSY domain-containing protein [Sphingobacteriaceae bacterium]|nr:MAG: PepSY domain-containing protein [Sphingobacteriaceae bacterium]
MKKKIKSAVFKKVNAFLHLWLGLISGLVVFIVALTGCLFSFQQEITAFKDHQLLFIKPPSSNTRTLSITKLQNIANQALKGNASFITTFSDPNRSWEFMEYQPGDQNAFWYFNTIKSYQSAFINPYNGKVLGLKDYRQDFFIIIKSIHWSLLLNDKYGQPIVGYATLIFVVLLISGLILWWPKNLKKANLDKSFRIKWKSGFKRINYDLHNVLGFYTVFIALILALTGMVFAMKWFEKTVYTIASQSTTPPKFISASSDSTQTALKNQLDLAFFTAKNSMPKAQRIGLSLAAGTKSVIYISGYTDGETYYNYDQLQFDQYSGKLLNRQNYQDKNNGEKIIGMNYDIHVGAIWGLPGKILMFLVSLVCTSLPVTGLIIWLNKKKNIKLKSQKIRKSVQHLIDFKERDASFKG